MPSPLHTRKTIHWWNVWLSGKTTRLVFLQTVCALQNLLFLFVSICNIFSCKIKRRLALVELVFWHVNSWQKKETAHTKENTLTKIQRKGKGLVQVDVVFGSFVAENLPVSFFSAGGGYLVAVAFPSLPPPFPYPLPISRLFPSIPLFCYLFPYPPPFLSLSSPFSSSLSPLTTAKNLAKIMTLEERCELPAGSWWSPSQKPSLVLYGFKLWDLLITISIIPRESTDQSLNVSMCLVLKIGKLGPLPLCLRYCLVARTEASKRTIWPRHSAGQPRTASGARQYTLRLSTFSDCCRCVLNASWHRHV